MGGEIECTKSAPLTSSVVAATVLVVATAVLQRSCCSCMRQHFSYQLLLVRSKCSSCSVAAAWVLVRKKGIGGIKGAFTGVKGAQQMRLRQQQ